jgi:hypothetical protein
VASWRSIYFGILKAFNDLRFPILIEKNRERSEEGKITIGVPLRLSPLLFALFINNTGKKLDTRAKKNSKKR